MRIHSLPVRSAIYECPPRPNACRVWVRRSFVAVCVIVIIWEGIRYAELIGWL